MTPDRLIEIELALRETTSCSWCLGMGFSLLESADGNLGEESCPRCDKGRVPKHEHALELLAAYRAALTEVERLHKQIGILSRWMERASAPHL